MFLSYDDDDNHGVRRADTAQALARWWRFGASHEAINMLHRAMCLAPYQIGSMVIAFAVEFVTFFYIVDDRVANKLFNSLTVNGFS